MGMVEKAGSGKKPTKVKKPLQKPAKGDRSPQVVPKTVSKAKTEDVMPRRGESAVEASPHGTAGAEKPCFDFLKKGKCRKGDSCPYSHDAEKAKKPKKPKRAASSEPTPQAKPKKPRSEKPSTQEKAPSPVPRVAGDAAEGTEICVKNLPFSLDEAALRKAFRQCGPVRTCRLLTRDGWSKGVAFIASEGHKKGTWEASLFSEASC